MFKENEFRAQVVRAGKTMKDIAECLGVDESTVYRKIRAGGDFSRDQINKLILFLKIDNPSSIFFAD